MRVLTTVLMSGMLIWPFCVVAAKGPAEHGGFRRQPPLAARSLKMTVGKEFSSGMVFVDGKYVPPPYKVDRLGTVIRVNGIQVTDPVVEWEEFLKTQPAAKVVVREQADAPAEAPSAVEPEPPPPPPPPADINDITSIFEDDTVPAVRSKPVEKKPATPSAAKPKPVRVVTTYALEGDFVPNDKSAALVAKVNLVRREIDVALRGGGYVFCGAGYSRVIGDSAAVRRLLETLPEVMKDNSSEDAFVAAARAAGMFYFPEALLRDLFRNRIDYPALIQRRKQMKEKPNWMSSLTSRGRPLS